MRSFLCAIGLVVLTAAPSAAQLLGGPAAKPADKPVAGQPAADAKGDKNLARQPRAGAPAAPQPNAMFAAIDADGDGVISKTELRKAIKALKTLDADDDGSITLAEASVGGAPIGPGGPLGEDPQIAQIMANDKNGDGKLTPNEVPRDMVQMLRGVDQNADGEITREELVVAMANMRNQNQIGAGPWRGAGGPAGGAGNANQATGQFLRFDKNGDGQLTEGELPADATRMLKGADRNEDDAIDAGELQMALEQQGSRARALRGGVDPDALRGRSNVRNRKPPGDNN